MTPPLDLAALRALLANATPLPWQDDGSTVAQDSNPWADVIPTEVECSMFCYGGSVKRARKEDISLIIAAVNALPALLNRLERAERDAKRFAFVATEVLSDTIIGLVDTSEEASIAAAENGREEVTDADRVYALRVAVDSVLKSPPTDAALTPTPEQP